MSFKSIGDLAISVLAKLEIEPGTERSTVKCAHPSGPHNTGREGDRVAIENGLPVYIAPRTGKRARKLVPQGGEAGETARELNKGTGANPRQLGDQEERQSEDSRGRISGVNRSLSNRKHTLTVLRLVSSKGGRAQVQRVAPLGARPSLVLVVNHAATSLR